jgi:hypothetical protein
MKNSCASAAILFCLSVPAVAADPEMVVNRGLPQVNLNNVSGESRSNVRLSNDQDGFVGDDFTIGAQGETWVIDAIRTWAVPSISVTSSKRLGDLYQDVRLYLGPAANALTPIASATLTSGSDDSENPDITISEITQNGAVPYDDFGTNLRIWQIEFTNLHKVVKGGTRYGFGVLGMGRSVPGHEDKVQPWFNHGSNAPLSAVQQDGADGKLLVYDGGGKFVEAVDLKGAGWDKSSDVNVQVLAHRLKSPVR